MLIVNLWLQMVRMGLENFSLNVSEVVSVQRLM